MLSDRADFGRDNVLCLDYSAFKYDESSGANYQSKGLCSTCPSELRTQHRRLQGMIRSVERGMSNMHGEKRRNEKRTSEVYWLMDVLLVKS